MRRRILLAAAGAVLSGCLGPTGTRTLPTPLPEDDALSVGEAAGDGAAEVTVWGADVRSSAFYRTGPRTFDVYAPDGHLLFVRLTARGDRRPPRSTFGLATADATLSPLPDVAGAALSSVVYTRAGQNYPAYAQDASPTSTGRWLLFEVPPGASVADPAVVWTPESTPPARWELPDRVRTPLGGPAPAFELESFEIPATAPPDGSPAATVRVRNTANADGVFRWALNYTGAVTAAETFSLSVPAGGTATDRRALPWSGRELTVELAWSGAERAVTVSPADG